MNLKKPKLKSIAEIQKRLRDLVHKHKKRYLKKHLTPCLENCAGALSVQQPDVKEFLRQNEDVCTFCRSRELGLCNDLNKFKPVKSKEEIIENFTEDIKNPKILPREYKDVAVMLWVLGYLDPEEDSEKEAEPKNED